MRSAPRFVWQVALVIVLLTSAHNIIFSFYDGATSARTGAGQPPTSRRNTSPATIS